MATHASDPTRLLIVYYSRSGAVEALATAAAEAAREAGAEVRVRRPREVANAAAMAKVDGWTESAARYLGWSVNRRPSSRPQRYLAPSFSWAALRVPVSFYCPTHLYEETHIKVEIPPYINSFSDFLMELLILGNFFTRIKHTRKTRSP